MTSTATASLPQEIWTYVYSYLKGSDPYNFALSCRKFAQVSRDPHARALLIINRCGGARLALYWVLMEVLDERILGVVRGRTTTSSSNGGPTFAFEITRQQRLAAQQRRLREGLGDGDDSPRRLAKLAGALTPEVATLLFQAGSILPRLLCQRCVREVGSLPSTALFTWIVGKSYQLYGEEAALDGDDQDWVSSLMTELEQRKISLQAQQQNYADGVSGGYDHAQFEESWRAVLAETASLSAAHTKLSDLITKYSFVPFPLNTPNSAYFLYRMSFIDLSLVDALVRNGLVLHSSSVNDEVMKWVLRKGNAQAISAYLEHGFRLTSAVVTLALQLARPEIMDSLQQFLTAEELQSYAEDAVFELLGPTRLCTTDTLLDHLRGTYNISEEVMARALLQVPEGAGYRTRPFMQQHPATAWRWALKAYGAHHRFSDAVFDDVLQKLASGPGNHCCLHSLPDAFFASGMNMKPHHIKHMAQMILHQETISVAESLLKNISDQLLGADEDLSWEQKSSWSQCLREEITENEELKTSIWNGWYEGNVAYSAVRLLDEVVHLEKDIGLRRSKRLRTLKRGHASNPSSNNNSGSSSSSGST